MAIAGRGSLTEYEYEQYLAQQRKESDAAAAAAAISEPAGFTADGTAPAGKEIGG